jgi:hypothetical protein
MTVTEVFADTFYFLALINPADQYHSEAIRYTGTPAGPWPSMTSLVYPK